MDMNEALRRQRAIVSEVVIRFAGDSGDGIQLTGNRFTLETALAGNDLATFPDYPAEIRAPAGTTYGVSSFQIHFGSREINTAGDEIDLLVALNPAALKTNLRDLRKRGMVIADRGTFTDRNLGKAGYATDPLDDGSLAGFRVVPVDISRRVGELVNHLNIAGLTRKQALRSRNMWALGLALWLYDRGIAATEDWIETRFSGDDMVRTVNLAALRAGFAYGETAELTQVGHPYHVLPAPTTPGTYRNITGTESLCMGLMAASALMERRILYCSYPITPASNMLHFFARHSDLGVDTFQAEDEIAAACAAIGASWSGVLGVTASSGPGVALKTEAVGLAAAVELPLVLINAQRGGPSTGLPTKTEQSDLFQAVFGRNADTPVVVLAVRSPGHGFDVAIEAARIAVTYMTPVIVLSDGYLANASEPWALPDLGSCEPIAAPKPTPDADFAPYQRDPRTLARPWAVPGVAGMQHRIGGLEREDVTGAVSYDPDNHQRMTELRCRKISRIADDLPPQQVESGPATGPLAVVGWGSTFGAIHSAVMHRGDDATPVSHVHLRHLWPLPSNLGELLAGFDHVLVPEMNTGQLATLLRSELGIDPVRFNKVQGRPFQAREITAKIDEILSTSWTH